MDFVMDRLEDGRRLKALTIVDDFLDARRSKSNRRELAPRLQREPPAQLDRLLDARPVRRAASLLRARCSAKPGDQLTLQPGLCAKQRLAPSKEAGHREARQA
jgi:hypothetical protein